MFETIPATERVLQRPCVIGVARGSVEAREVGSSVNKFIAIAGNIGAGKSSLVEFLDARYGFDPIYEPFAGNPYLDDFYGDMKRWAFHSQLYFLTHKFRLHLQLNEAPRTFVQDRTIYEDAEIFATNLFKSKKMTERDYATYMELYESMKTALRPPDLLIYLRCSTRAIRRRIKQRGRESEQSIPTAYLRQLNGLYEDWIDRYTASPVLVWDSERLDYLTNLVDQLEFKNQLKRFL
ncbi:MAG: deoxynucleoside kinase [Deltaproteobacteria bacterium]|nr:deoxynucleoside kinase [Deltaproteobacteria bacterium]